MIETPIKRSLSDDFDEAADNSAAFYALRLVPAKKPSDEDIVRANPFFDIWDQLTEKLKDREDDPLALHKLSHIFGEAINSVSAKQGEILYTLPQLQSFADPAPFADVKTAEIYLQTLVTTAGCDRPDKINYQPDNLPSLRHALLNLMEGMFTKHVLLSDTRKGHRIS